jgi:acid stress-induced BolA-like protein IbaG/YrbA
MTSDEVARLIEKGLDDSRASVLSEDQTHFEAVVISSEFAGQTTLQRHQMIYATLGGLVGGEIHALSIRAYTPEEWTAAGGQ